MPKLSVVIPYYEIDSGKRDVLKRCIDSIKGQYDELILVWNQGAGFVPAVNKGYELASGDFIALVCDDVVLKKGVGRQAKGRNGQISKERRRCNHHSHI